MTLPKWNVEWEKPDPLRGKRGWSRHHYVTVGGAVLLLVAALGFLPPPVAKVRSAEQRLDQVGKQFRKALFPPGGDSLRPR